MNERCKEGHFMFPLAEPEMRTHIEQIDKQIDQLDTTVRKEIARLNRSCETYLNRVRIMLPQADPVLRSKLMEAGQILRSVQQSATTLDALLESLKNLKQVNKMVWCVLGHSKNSGLMSLSSFIGPVSNVCLGQLKHIRSRYESTLRGMNEQITDLWMDRDLARAIRLVLFVNNLQYNMFMTAFLTAEVLYADLSLGRHESHDGEFHQFVVLRMISNRLSSLEEQQIIDALFPQWKSLPRI